MKKRIAVSLVLGTLLCAGIWFFDPTADVIGADGSNAMIMSMEDNSAESLRLNAKQSELRARIDYKEQLLNAMIDGDMTLLEVAAEFARVNINDETTMHMMRCAYPGDSDTEKAAHNVIDFIKVRQMPEAQKEKLLADSYAELRCAFPHPR